ncbi:MAG TPA: HAMP domain-containing sensor histidine kinase [Rubrobacter sp.]|nr:HAMP domain-containing sensor histidine kinase [Rubrobacter sp.]
MPIRWRLTLFIAMVIGAILLVLGLTLFFLLRGALLSGIEDTVRNRAVTSARDVQAGETVDEEDADELTLDGVFVLVRDGQGRVLTRTVDLKSGEERDPVWKQALESDQPEDGVANLSPEGSDYVYAVPVDPREGPARVVEAGKSYGSARETLGVFGGVLAAGIGTAFLLSIAGAYVLAGAALRPVEAVTGAAREMGEGDLSKRLPVANPRDEVGRLANTINGLLSRLEAAFARREEALERQRRFAADASHELRTPLTAISGHARMLDEWALEEDPERARRSVGEIRREAGRMRNLVESLLALTRGDEDAGLEVGRHDLAAVAEEAAQAARDAADGKLSVEYVRPRHAIEATFDRNRVFQVASILLDNAVKYTPEDGGVAVTLREEDHMAVLEVSDTGVGIAEDELPLVFERFYRTDHSRADGGAGLGLSIARQIAESHGGEIRARSVPGEGSAFTLLLPLQPRS